MTKISASAFITLLALGLAGSAAQARDPQSVFTDIRNTAPRTIFDDIRDSAPRSPFDEKRDQAPRSDGVFGELERSAP
jgi:hypothetical protein